MKNITLSFVTCFSIVLFSHQIFSQQNIEFGFSYQGTIAVFTNKKANVEQIFETLHVTKYEGELSKKQKMVWTTNETRFDVYLKNKRLFFSAGLREFNWRYSRDSINHPLSSGPGNNYADSKRTYSTVLPFLSAGYVHKLTDKSECLFSATIGYMGIFKRSRQKFKGHDESQHIHYWENLNEEEGWFKYKGKFNSYAFDCRVSTDYRYQVSANLRLNAGLSYYFAQNGITLHYGLYGNLGISLIFNKHNSESGN